MFIYIFLLLWLFYLGNLDVSKNIAFSTRKKLFYLTFFLFWILSFIRWQTGTDWDSYHDCFANNYTLYDFEQRSFEPLYTYLNFIIKQITSYYWVFLLVCGALIFPLTSKTIFVFSPLPFVSLLIYLLIRRADIFFVRESIALAFCFYAIKYIINRSLLKFVLCVLVGFGFHNGVIAFLPAYFLFNIKINPRRCIIGMGVLLVVMIALQGYITNTFGQVASILGDSFLDKTNKYMERGYESGGATSVASAMIRGSINRAIFLFMFLYGLKQHPNDRMMMGLLNLYMFSIVIFILLAPFSLTLNRVGDAYEMASILLIGYTFDRMPRRKRSVVYLLFFLYIAIRFFMGTLFGVYSEEFLPYKTIFD